MTTSRVQMSRQDQMATQDFEEPLVDAGGPKAGRMSRRPPQKAEPPDAQGEAEHHGRSAHGDGIVPRHPRHQHRFDQSLSYRQIPAFRLPLGDQGGHHPISAPPAKPKKSRKKVEAAK